MHNLDIKVYRNMKELIRRIEKKLEANWPVDKQEIQALIDYIKKDLDS